MQALRMERLQLRISASVLLLQDTISFFKVRSKYVGKIGRATNDNLNVGIEGCELVTTRSS